MEGFVVGEIAPDFALPDHNGEAHRLAELLKRKSVLLVFNIGFA